MSLQFDLSDKRILKRAVGDVLHYLVMQGDCIIAYIDLNTTTCGNYWVRHSVASIGHQGVGAAVYRMVLQDVYPKAIMPSRECTSGYAISIWADLWKDKLVSKKPIEHWQSYVDEFDEWEDEILAVNPLLTESALAAHNKEFTFFLAVIEGDVVPHPYNHYYTLKPNGGFTVVEMQEHEYYLLKDANDLFYERYEKLDF